VKQLFLFVRPPRAIWPFNGPSTSFWPPLAFASLAAALRESIRDLDVAILDCPSIEMGWKSLARELDNRCPTYVGIGEEAVSAHEGLRLAAMAKSLGAKVIAGGCTFGNLAEEVLSTGLVDVVVRGEGEKTIVETVEALRANTVETALNTVRGVTFRSGDQTVVTENRPLIEHLDSLPMPAYDLLPMERYGRGSLNHPDLATLEASRGCIGSCDFCVLWKQMGAETRGATAPCYRSKSPARLLEEVEILARRYGRRYLCWVDPCFNGSPDVLEEFAEGMRRKRIVIGQSAWVRTDLLARDERSGLLERLVATGLNEIFVGVERANGDLSTLGKSWQPPDALSLLPELSRKYPSLYVVGSFIYGLPQDSWRTVKAMRDATMDLNLDMAFYIPLTGLPGTKFWNKGSWDTGAKSLSAMSFLTFADDADGRRLTWLLAASLLVDWRPKRIAYTLRSLLAQDARKRRMNRRLVLRGAKFALKRLASPVLFWDGDAMQRPAWYDK
jgi:anaerobic magnesium-protoporphyrin IX monomethyl ester cyclase